jgi:iron complex outermembrane receptor protein
MHTKRESFKFLMMRVLLVAILITIMHGTIAAQTRIIKGTVIDSSYQPLKGVTIQCLPLNIITKTDNNGRYKIICPDSIKYIIFSKVGFRSQSAILNGEEEINVILTPSELAELSLQDLLQVNVSTVTLKEQKITDAPGVVSIITSDDLNRFGIRTVREALLLVPGFVPLQNDDEQIMAVRGIFATTNQKILLMRDGHSLNEGNIDLPQTDYSLSIENIKKIEIIRGPGASIYGNSALAAVVNIITTDENEVKARAGLGNYGQYNIDLVSRAELKTNGSVLVFARYAGTGGEPYNVTVAKDTSVGTFRANHYPNNYDLGIKLKLRATTTDLSLRHHNYKTYWSAKGLYTNVDSLAAEPRLVQNSIHFNHLYNPRISDFWDLNFQHSIDYCSLNNIRLLNPTDTAIKHDYVQWNEWNVVKLGLNYYSSLIYSTKGQILFGLSFEQRRYLDTWNSSDKLTPSRIMMDPKPFFPKGNEIRGAGYFQIQYSPYNWAKLDLGVRYDIAQNIDESFNPRVAVILNPLPPLTFKVIYTKAFQAPGYSYRTSNADYSGSIERLQSEKLTTYQTSVRYVFKKTSYMEVTGFYNKLSNLITRINNRYYANFYSYATYGLEAEGIFAFKYFSTFVNYSFLLPHTRNIDSTFKARNIYNKEFKHFPKHNINAGLNLIFLKQVNLSLYGQYASPFRALQDYKANSRLLLNSTLLLSNFIKNVELSASIYNLTNMKYKLGDPSVIPIEQPGRWYMLSIFYRVNNN